MPRRTGVLDRLVGVRVCSRRQALGLSQDELGRLIGVAASRVQDYEQGARRIGTARLAAIARALHVPTSYFFDIQDGGGKPSIRLPESLGPHEAVELLTAFASIADTGIRHRVVNLVRALSAAYPASAK